MTNPGITLRAMWESYWNIEKERLKLPENVASAYEAKVRRNFFAGVAALILVVDVRDGVFDCEALQKECGECGFPFQRVTAEDIANMPQNDHFSA